jgi:hypothetical protein
MIDRILTWIGDKLEQLWPGKYDFAKILLLFIVVAVVVLPLRFGALLMAIIGFH